MLSKNVCTTLCLLAESELPQARANASTGNHLRTWLSPSATEDYIVLSGTQVTMSCFAIGPGPVSYSWRKLVSTGFESVPGGTQSSPYIVRPPGEQSLVVFQCAVRNPLITTGDHSSVAQQFFKVLGKLQRKMNGYSDKQIDRLLPQ